jgi:hypothetical protein
MRFREEGFREFLEEAIEWEDLEPTALGIAKQALNQGVESLSEKQYFVFQKHVLEAHAVNRCIQCEEEIPWHEMIDVHRDGGYCIVCMRRDESMGRNK